MKKKYNWAILGCGKIARKFSSDLKLLPNARLYATASRDLEKAKAFAGEFGFQKAFGSYEEMVKDPDVDAVYVATPHSFHYQNTILCLKNKKAVLCEKAFSMNFSQALEMVECAKENNTFLMEAFWTMFQPSFKKAMEIVNSGDLGKLKLVRSDFAFSAQKDPENRLYNLKLGGGSLLDIGIYPVFAALTAFGKPDELKTLVNFSPSGAEESINMIFKYKGGEMASLVSSFAAYSPTQTDYCCENGYVVLNPRWYAPTSVTVWKDGKIIDSFPPEKDNGWGYNYEAAHVMECLDNGQIESKIMTWQRTLDMMETLDRIRKDAGIVYPDFD